MKISSPYYPQYYFTDGIGCEWLIKTTKGNIISLEFNNFEVSIFIHKIYLLIDTNNM